MRDNQDPRLHHGGPGPRPLIWSTGPDPARHQRFVAWCRSRSQAQYRGESWQLGFEDFERTWGDRWCQRGRGSEDLCMTRLDPEQPWKLGNVAVITRREWHRREQQRRQPR
jgi:hypothetical protein